MARPAGVPASVPRTPATQPGMPHDQARPQHPLRAHGRRADEQRGGQRREQHGGDGGLHHASPSAPAIAAATSAVPADPPRSGVRGAPAASTRSIAREHLGGGLGVAEVVEHQRRRPHRADRIGDPLAGDVGGRAVHGLEHRRVLALGVEVAPTARCRCCRPPPAARSLRMSPNRFEPTMTSSDPGRATSLAHSASMCSWPHLDVRVRRPRARARPRPRTAWCGRCRWTSSPR